MDIFNFDDYFDDLTPTCKSEIEPVPFVLDKSEFIGPKHRHIIASSMGEVLSIRLNRALDDEGVRPTKCDIYGCISVVDTRLGREVFTLFHKDENNAQTIDLGDPLLLTPSSLDALMVPPKYTKLVMHLSDRKANNTVVARGEFVFDEAGDECERDHFKDVYGDDKGIYARVNYIVYQYAVAATIDVIYFSKDDDFDLLTDPRESEFYDSDNDYGVLWEAIGEFENILNYDEKKFGNAISANVCGSVTVLGNKRMNDTKDCSPIVVFSNTCGEDVHVKSRDFIELSRSTLIVPAYSPSLVVKVDLSHCDSMKSIASGILEFKTQHKDTFKKDIVGEHGRVRVRVTWNHHPYDPLLYKKETEDKPEPKVDVQEGTYQRVEVFTVVVYSQDSKPFTFYGKICFRDPTLFCAFNKDERCPQISPGLGAVATIRGPFSRVLSISDYFSVFVNLKDAKTGAHISHGEAPWCARIIEGWFDMRLCSVIRGERGFAAIHYTAFSDARSAIVAVKFSDLQPGYVYGKIVASYGTCEYVTQYDKDYYRSILFERQLEDEESKQAQTCDSYLTLLKPIVCYPRKSSLIIEVDLSVSYEPSFDGGFPSTSRHLQGKLIMQPNGLNGFLESLRTETCCIDVSVTPRYRY